MRASEQANLLWPFLIKKVEKVVSSNRNGGSSSAPTPTPTPISFFDLTNVEDTGWDEGEVPTWDAGTSTFIPVSPLGGDTYTAGDGIDVTSHVISAVAHATRGIIVDSGGIGVKAIVDGGLLANVDGLYISLKTNSGLDIDGDGLSVVSGDGIVVTSGEVSVDIYSTTSGLAFTSGDLRVDKAADFTWTGQHQFNVDPQINSNLDFIGADRTITSSSDLYIVTGDDLILPDDGVFRSDDFADVIPISGFSLHLNTDLERQLTVNTIKADSIHTRMFVADMVRVDVGEEYWGKSLGILYDNFIVPAIDATTTIIVEDSVRFSGALFEEHDWVLIQAIEGGTGSEFHSDHFWGQVTSYVDLGLDDAGIARQQWTYRHRSGPTGWLIKKGNLVIDFGGTGQGYAHLSVLESAQGPFFRIGEWNGANPYTSGNVSIKTQIGNLDGISDADLNPAGYGLYSENAYLKGILRTVETILDDDGISMLLPTVASGTDIGAHAQVAWWDDLDDRSGTPGARLASWFDSTSDSALMHMKAHSSTDNAWIYLEADGTGAPAFISMHSADGLEMHADSYNLVSSYGGITLDVSGLDLAVSSTARLRLFPAGVGTLEARGNLIPEADITYDLGSGVKRWKTIYADDMIVSGGISGDTISGAEWEFAGSMVIDANSASNTTVSVTNQGAGRADLSVDRDIIVGGSVDGVDVSVLNAAYAAHIANADAHHDHATAGNGIAISGQVVSVDLATTPGLAFSSGDLYVLDYHGITRDANGISVDLQTTSGLSLDATGLAINDTVAGDGLSISGKILAVGEGDGIDVVANAISVDVTEIIDTSFGLTASSNDIRIDLAATSGLLFSSGDLAVGAGNGINVLTSSIEIDLKATSGLEVDVAGLAIADSVAGDGLSVSSKVLAVGAGDGIDVNSNTIMVDVTDFIDTAMGLTETDNNIQIDLAANSGLTFSSGDLAMGTPGTLNHTTTSVVTGSQHWHDIQAESDVSPGEERILKSNAGGGLILNNLTVSGAVDVGEGMTVGNNTIRMIYHTHDYPHTHMVINPTGLWSFDEQFGLDIDDNLLVRGWIVGKHAIQIKGAEMLVHFDGMPPVETNFTGNPTGHMGQKGTRVGGVSFRAGKFGKAVLTGEATTNLVTNPSFETNTTSWVANGAGATIDRPALGNLGTYALRLLVSGAVGANYVDYQYVALTSGTTYTLSLMVSARTTTADIVIRVIRFSDGSITGQTTYTPAAVNDWSFQSVTFTAPATGNYSIRVGYTGITNGNILIDEVQLEAKAYATPYCDGSLGDLDPDSPGVDDGYDWTGSAHSSTSTRTAAYVSYDDESLDDWGKPCTVMVWAKPSGNTGSVQTIVSKANVGNTAGWEMSMSGLSLRTTLRNPDTDLNTGASLTVGEWNHCCFTWTGAALKVYLDGVEVGSTTGSSSIVSANNFLVGRRAAGDYFNGLIDEVVLVNRVLTEDEIRAIYESDAPVFAETSSWHFRAGRNRIYADSEGLWGYGASGAPIIGLYAGEDNNPSATKSWGGKTLSEGDLLLGRYGASDGGWMYFDQDLVGGDPAWLFGYGADEVLRLDSGGASLTGVFDISTSGGIYQGTGSFATPTTGLKIWNASGIGRIGGYSSGTVQWSANTSGKLVAGGGTVVLGEDGIDVAITSSSASAANSYNFSSSGTRTAYISGQDAAGVRQVNMELLSGSGKDSAIYISALAPSAKLGYVSLTGFVNSVSVGNLLVGKLVGSEPTQVTITRNLHVEQTSTTFAAPTLVLTQSDLSEEFIRFNSTVAAGNAINTTALGAYYGRVRVSVNGSNKWIALYDA